MLEALIVTINKANASGVNVNKLLTIYKIYARGVDSSENI